MSRSSRQALYDRIRSSSKDVVIWEEMIRLGFWPADGDGPNGLASELARKREIQRELAALRSEQARLRDEEAILKAVRKQRMAAARERREETKARREAARVAKARAWRARKAVEIVYLGEGVSYTLNQTDGDAAALQRNGLTNFDNAGALASAMGITVGQLRFLTYSRSASQTTHWRRFQVPKKTGGHRLISAPMPRLKAAQHWVLQEVLTKVDLHDAAHGFVPGRSIVSNAQPHLGKAVVVNLDLQNFFPTVAYPRVWGLFRSLGYSPAISTLFALLCTEPPLEEVELDGATWYVATGQRVLPQGAPTSPAITNLICRGLDRRLTAVGKGLGFVYTRYADDLSFSSEQGDSKSVGTLLRRVRHVIREEGFVVHPDKTRVHRRGRRQEVTGLTVNDKLAVDRKTLRRFRAAMHRAETKGPEHCDWGAEGVDVLSSLMGFANFVHMVDPEKGAPLRARARALWKKHRGDAPMRTPRAPTGPTAPRPSPAGAPPSPAAPTPAADPNTGAGNEPASDEGGDGQPWWKLW